MGFVKSVKKALGIGSNKKKDKKKQQQKPVIQTTQVAQNAQQISSQQKKTGGHQVQPQKQKQQQASRGVSTRSTGRGNGSIQRGTYGGISVKGGATPNRQQTGGIQRTNTRSMGQQRPQQRTQQQPVRSGGHRVQSRQVAPVVKRGNNARQQNSWVRTGSYGGIQAGPNVRRDRSQTNGIQRRQRSVSNPVRQNPVQNFRNATNTIWKGTKSAAPQGWKDFSREWKASGKGQRDYKSVTTRGRTTPSGSTVEVMPKGLKPGDRITTTQGTYTITGKKKNSGDTLKQLDQLYDQAVARYAQAQQNGNQAEVDFAQSDLQGIADRMMRARYDVDESSKDQTKQSAAFEKIEKAQEAWWKANAEGNQEKMDKAHRRAEKARASMGFSGGEAGNEYRPFNEPVQQRTEPLTFGERFRGARDYANTQAINRENEKYVGDVNTYNQAMQKYEAGGEQAQREGQKNRGQMKREAMNQTGPSGGTANPTAGSYNAQLAATQQNISDRERYVYNYLYSTQGKKAADNFLSAAWNVNISQQAANRANHELEDWAKVNPVAATVTSTMMQPFNTMAGAGQMINNAVTGRRADPYFTAVGNTTNTSREAVKSNIKSGVGRGAYDVGTNIADMVLDTLIGGGIGSAAGMGAKATAKLAAKRGAIGRMYRAVAQNPVADKMIGKLLSSSTITTGLMSTQSAYSTYVQSVQSGVSTDVALTNAVVNGALEYLSEAPAVEGLFSIGKLGRMGGAPISNMKDFAKRLAHQMGVEAGGETFANLTQTAADSVLMGSRSQIAQQTAAYEGQGMSPEEALKQARIDSYFTQTWQAAAMGAIAGGIMGGGGMGIATVRSGNYMRSDSDFARDLASVYLNEMPDGQYRETAEGILYGERNSNGRVKGVSTIKAANMKGELAKHYSEIVNSDQRMSELYEFVGLDRSDSATQRLKDVFAQYTGRETGFAGKEFGDAWIKRSMLMLQQAQIYEETGNPEVRKLLEDYFRASTELLYSGELNDAAETTSIVRAVVNNVLNGINANAGGNSVVSEDIDTVLEEGQINEEGDPVETEEAGLMEEQPNVPVNEAEAQQVNQAAENIQDVAENVIDTDGIPVQAQSVQSTPNETLPEQGELQEEAQPVESGQPVQGQQTAEQVEYPATSSYPTGKKNPKRVAYHSSAQNPAGRVESARQIASGQGYDVSGADVIEERDDGTVNFVSTDDFDRNPEPRVTRRISVNVNDGTVTEENPENEIIPDKSEYVSADYEGFDVGGQKFHEQIWKKSGVRYDPVNINNADYFYNTFGDYIGTSAGEQSSGLMEALDDYDSILSGEMTGYNLRTRNEEGRKGTNQLFAGTSEENNIETTGVLMRTDMDFWTDTDIRRAIKRATNKIYRELFKLPHSFLSADEARVDDESFDNVLKRAHEIAYDIYDDELSKLSGIDKNSENYDTYQEVKNFLRSTPIRFRKEEVSESVFAGAGFENTQSFLRAARGLFDFKKNGQSADVVIEEFVDLFPGLISENDLSEARKNPGQAIKAMYNVITQMKEEVESKNFRDLWEESYPGSYRFLLMDMVYATIDGEGGMYEHENWQRTDRASEESIGAVSEGSSETVMADTSGNQTGREGSEERSLQEEIDESTKGAWKDTSVPHLIRMTDDLDIPYDALNRSGSLYENPGDNRYDMQIATELGANYEGTLYIRITNETVYAIPNYGYFTVERMRNQLGENPLPIPFDGFWDRVTEYYQDHDLQIEGEGTASDYPLTSESPYMDYGYRGEAEADREYAEGRKVNDAERLQESDTSRNTAELEPVSSSEREGRTEEDRGESGEQSVPGIPENGTEQSGAESEGTDRSGSEQSSEPVESSSIDDIQEEVLQAFEDEDIPVEAVEEQEVSDTDVSSIEESVISAFEEEDVPVEPVEETVEQSVEEQPEPVEETASTESEEPTGETVQNVPNESVIEGNEAIESEGENGTETIVAGENDNGDRGSSGTIRQTEEEQQPEESGAVDIGQSVPGGTDNNSAENESDSETDRERKQPVSQGSAEVRPGRKSDTNERTGDSSSEYDRAGGGTRFYIGRGINEKNPYQLSETQRIKSNIEAIKLVKKLDEEGRQATLEEKQILSMYTGWGGISGAFDDKENETNAHRQRREELESLLSKDEYEAARRSSISAYYTPYTVIDNVYQVASQVGVRPGGRVLEPSCGVGAFIGCMPHGIREHSSVTAVEWDRTSGRIAQLIYDDINVEIQDFGKNEGSYSLIVGNVPFGKNLKLITDKSFGKNIWKYDIQDGFIAKGLAQLDEGCIMAILTTHSTMDGNKAKNIDARKSFAEQANLIGAIRFPNNTFAGTDTVTDLLIFQKKGEGVNNDYAQDFSQLHELENGTTVNQYFIDHPEMVLGDIKESDYRGVSASNTVIPNESKTFEKALEQIPAAIVPETRQNKAEKDDQKVAETVRKDTEKPAKKTYDGGLSIIDGEVKVYDEKAKIYRPFVPLNGNMEPYKLQKDIKPTIERAKSMIEIAQQRDYLLALENELDDSTESQERIEAEKKKLSDMAERYIQRFGRFDDKYGKSVARTDSATFGKCNSLYEFSEKDGETIAKKSSILEQGKRVVAKKRDKFKKTKNIKRAIRSSMYEYGYIDMSYMQKLTGKTEDEIVSGFDHTIYYDPVDGVYQQQGIYLSGNIYKKVAELKEYINAHPDEADKLERNLHELENAKPARKTADMIQTNLGSPWASPSMIEDFLSDYFGIPKGEKTKYGWNGVHLAYDSAIGKWNINLPDYLLDRSKKFNGVEWNVGGKSISDYLNYFLNNSELNINKDAVIDGETKRVKDEVKTEEAKQKAEALNNAFSEWILKDSERMSLVENVFNEQYNYYVAPTYDVDGFVYDGMNPNIELNHHQSVGVARATQNQNTLFMHPVGSGKTFTMIAAAMEWHRLGQSKKTALVCQKNKITDFQKDILNLYPNAKVLAVEDFSDKNRGYILSLIQNNDYDFIIFNYDAFRRIPLSKDYMERYRDEQVGIYRDAINRMNQDADYGKSKSVSQLEKSILTYEQLLTKHIDETTKDQKPGDLFFENLGIDSLVVDEAQNYKNLPQVTSLSRVKGVAHPIGEKVKNKKTGEETMAGISNTYLHMITSLMNERKNHIAFATATPVTNTLGELYAYLRYLMPETLKESGLDSFDGWVKMFAEKTQSNELTPAGRIKTVERLGKYINLGALRKYIAPVFDIVSKSSIEKIKIPQAKTLQVIAPASESLIMLNNAAELQRGNAKEDPSVFLKMYQLTKDAALDMRLVRQRAIDMGIIPPDTTNEELDFANSKINLCVKQVLEDYELTNEEKGVQVIFLDRGMKSAKKNTTPDGSDISLYDDIIDKLVAGGIPRNQIASMSPTDKIKKVDKADQAKIMDKANKGEIRVIIGSSSTAGVGINIQTLLYAAHHVDMPDVPADYEQRNGRILRQHNNYADEEFQKKYGKDKVKLYHYSTSNSQDAARLQMVDRKASMINAPFENDNVEELEDQDDVSTVLQKMEIGAANVDALFELEDQKKKVLELTAKENGFRSKQATYSRTRANYAETKERLESNISKYQKGQERVKKVKKNPTYTVNGQTYEKMQDASKAAYQLFENATMIQKRDGVIIGEIDGIKIKARETKPSDFNAGYGSFKVEVTEIPWFGIRDFTKLNDKGEPVNKNPKVNKPQNIFEIVRNQLDPSKGDTTIENAQESLVRWEKEYQEALKHVDDTSPYTEQLQEAQRKKSELEKAFGERQAPSASDIHMVSKEDLGKMNGDVRVEDYQLESTKEDQRMAEAAAKARKPKQVTSSIIEVGEEENETESENGIKFAREKGKGSKTKTVRVVEETREPEVVEYTESYESTNRTPTRGNFHRSSAYNTREVKGITSDIIANLKKSDREAAKDIKSILDRTKAYFPKVNFHTQRYRGAKAAGVLGFYDQQHLVINTQSANQLGTTMHELGHHLVKVYDIFNNPEIPEAFSNMVNNIPGMYSTLKAAKYRSIEMPEEVFADFVWHYMINPDSAWQMGSYAGKTNFYETFEKMLTGTDLNNLQDVRRLVLAFNNKTISERISSTIKTRKQAKKGRPTVLKVLKGEKTGNELGTKWHNIKRSAITSLVDFTRPGKEITDQIETVTGKKLTSDMDLQYAVESMTMADSMTTQILTEGFITPDMIIMEDQGSYFSIINELEEEVSKLVKQGKLTKKEAANWFNDFERYLRDMHGIDWESYGKSTMSSDVAGEYDVDKHDANINAYLADIGSINEKYGSLMQDTANKLYDWWKTFNQIWMVDTGLVDQETMRNLWEIYPHYIPMYRDMSDQLEVKSNSSGGNTNQVLQRSSKEGSERDVLSPIENMTMYINRVLKTYHRNEIARTVDRLWTSSDQDVQAVMGSYVVKIDTPESVNTVNMEGLKERIKSEMEKRGDDPSIIDEFISDQIQSFYADPGKAGSDVLICRKGKSVTCYRIVDKPFYDMLQATNKDGLGAGIKALGKMTRVWSGLVTSNNIFFAIRNAVRDWQHAYVMGKDFGKGNWEFFWRYPQAFAEVLFNTYKKGEKNELIKLYQAANDFESKYTSSGEGQLERALEQANVRYRKTPRNYLYSLVNFIIKFNAAIEAVPRYAQFKATYTKSDGNAKEKFAQAMRNSREITVNFHKGGSSNLLGVARSVVPFLNAATAGIKQAQETILSKEAWTTKEGRGRIIRMLAIQSIPALLLGLLYHDDKEYKQMENYLKEGYWLFKLGDTWIRLPKDREYSAFASTPVTQFLAAQFDEDFTSEEAVASISSYMLANWIPSVSPTFAGIVQAWANRAWYGGRIVSSYYDDALVADHYKNVYDGTTSRLGIAIGNTISKLPGSWQDKLGTLATPKGIDYAIDQMSGVIGDFVIPLEKKTEGVEGMLAGFRNQFVADPYKSDKYISELYDIKDQINAGSFDGEMTDLDKKWEDAVNATMRQSRVKEGEEPDFKTFGDYAAEMREIKENDSISYSEKQKQITDLYKAMGRIAEEMVKRYRKGLGPLKDNYGDVNLTEEAKAAGFTENNYAKALSDVNGQKTYSQKEYYIASSNLTDDQKQYLSQHVINKDYSDYSERFEPLIEAGLTQKQVDKYYGSDSGNIAMKRYKLVKDGKLTDDQKNVIGKDLTYSDELYTDQTLQQWRDTYQPMIDAGWSAKKAMQEIEATDTYESNKANIVNALQRYPDDPGVQNAMVNLVMGAVKTYDTKRSYYTAYAESGMDPELIDKAYARHKELQKQGMKSRDSYAAAAKEYASGKEYNLLFNVLYMR